MKPGDVGLKRERFDVTVLLVDAMNLYYRYALVGSNDTEKRKFWAVEGGLVGLGAVVRETRPGKVVVVWDGAKSDWRRKLYPDYKLRSGDPSEQLVKITSQLPAFKQVLNRLPVFTVEANYEADDVIAALARVFSDHNNVVVASNDRDFYQLLIDDRVSVFNSKGRIGLAEFADRYSFLPDHWAEYIALVGDPSDNIRGVDGIGEVRAEAILSEGGVLDHLEKRGKYADKILPQLDVFCRNVKLVDFGLLPEKDAVLKAGLKALRTNDVPFDRDEFHKFCFSNKLLRVLRDFPRWVGPFQYIDPLAV